MKEQKIQDLLDYLHSIGFPAPLLEKEIRDHIAIEALEFGARCEVQWGEEKMQFTLRLLKDQQFQAYRLGPYKADHIAANGIRHSRNFAPTGMGICHPTLSYFIVSGRWDDLTERLSPLKLEEFPGMHLMEKLEEKLSHNPDHFELKCFRNEPEGFVEFIIPVSKKDGWYAVDTYKAILTPYPSIDHRTCNGVDTAMLEDQMRRVDWHNDHELFVFHTDSEPEFKPKVGDIQEQLYRLSLDMVGADIADKLQLKYWSDATFFENSLQQSAWDYLDSLPKREQIFPVELEAKAAFNMLCGRAILQNRVYPLPHDKPAWVRFDFTTKGPNGGYLTEVMPDFDRVQIETILNALPIPADVYPRIIRELIRGDITRFTLPDNKNIFLEANPEQKTINIFSEDMLPIPFNLHFDPDWKPTQNPELKPEELKRKPRQNIIQPDKGKRLRRRR